MKEILLRNAAYLSLIITTLLGCGGKLYGHRKKVKVNHSLAKAVPQPQVSKQKIDIVPNTQYGISKPVEEKKKPSVISADNPSSSSMVR